MGASVQITERASDAMDQLTQGRHLEDVALAALEGTLPTLSPEQLTRLQQLADGAKEEQVARTGQFYLVQDLRHGTLEVRRGANGLWECRLTLKDIGLGGTQAKAEALCDEINSRVKGLPNCPQSGWRVKLSGNNDLPLGSGDVVIQCFPLVKDSTHKKRYQQEALLSEQGLSCVPHDAVCLIAGLFRLWKGFPDQAHAIGMTGDHGDVFEGKTVRTMRGPRGGSVASYPIGVFNSFGDFYDKANVNVGISGAIKPE